MDMVVKTVFFDVSDTLYSCPAFEDALARCPVNLLADRRRISFDEAKGLFEQKRDELRDKAVHVTKGAVLKEFGVSRMELLLALLKVDPRGYLQPDGRLAEILDRLNERFELGIITNVLRANLSGVLGALRINEDCFKHIVAADDVDKGKPDLEPFLKAVGLSGFRPDECVYVGDSLTKDMIPARRAGMRTVWVSRDGVADNRADVHIEVIYDVWGALARL